MIGLIALAALATGCGAGGTGSGGGPQRPITEAAVVEGKVWQLEYVSEQKLSNVADLAVVSADEAWAVAFVEPPNSGLTMLHRKDGRWKPAPLPDGVPPAPIGLHLEASSPDDVWLFWFGPDGAGAARWDGTRWQAMPGDPAVEFGVQDVAVLAPDDVWTLVGRRDASHWDGKRWHQVRLPAPATAIDGRTAGDVWAVGATKPFEEPGGHNTFSGCRPDHREESRRATALTAGRDRQLRVDRVAGRPRVKGAGRPGCAPPRNRG